MSAWAEIINADGSDEWLAKCSEALGEIQAEQRRRSAALVRSKIAEWSGMSDYVKPGNSVKASIADLIERNH